MDASVMKRLAETTETGDLGVAAMILCESKSDPDFYSVAFAALCAASTYGNNRGFETAMAKIAHMQNCASPQ